MLCINNSSTDVYFNLAAEEYLLNHFTEDVFMLWQNEPSVVLGRHQRVRSEVNLAFVGEKQINVARRHSGGGTVYHDMGNLNLTFIESSNNPDFNKYTRQMLDILSLIGIHAQVDERHGLTLEGLKISGSAQYLRKDKVMFHATLLYSANLENLKLTLEPLPITLEDIPETTRFKSVKSVKSAVTNISDHLMEPLSLNDFKNIIIKHYIGKSAQNIIYTFNKEDQEAITFLKNAKYATSGWNFSA